MTVHELQALTTSIVQLASYPENLLHKTTYIDALKTYRHRLDELEKSLCVLTEGEVNVPFRDLIGNGPEFERHKVHDDGMLQTRLGEASKINPNVGTVRREPKCRFIFLYADHSFAPLKITRKMLVRILTYYQVMPNFLDFLLLFGGHKHSREKRFSGFRAERNFDKPVLNLDSLGRSGNFFQTCYNLKAVGRKTPPGQLAPSSVFWTVRQCAIYHQLDVVNGSSLWILTRANLDIKERVESLTGKAGRDDDRRFQTPEQCFRSALAVHLLLCYWSFENWRAYLQWLEDSVEAETLAIAYGPRGKDTPPQASAPAHLQRAQSREEEVAEAIMVMKGNCNVLQSLKGFYQVLLDDSKFPLQNACSTDILSFAAQLESFIYDSNMLIDRAKLLAETIAARKTMILQHLQSQATEKMEKLTSSMRKDSLTVRIIAFITFVYLPATFVSTFFSTDVVKYQDQNSGSQLTAQSSQSSSFSSLALSRWLQVALPLTFLTFAMALFWQWRETRKLKQGDEEQYAMTEIND